MPRSLQVSQSCNEHILIAACDTAIEIEIDGAFLEQHEELIDYLKILGISVVEDQSARDKRAFTVRIVRSAIFFIGVNFSVSNKCLPAEKGCHLIYNLLNINQFLKF